MKVLALIVVAVFCFPLAFIVVPIVLGALGLAIASVVLAAKLLFPILIIWIVWKLLIESPRRA